MDIHTNIQNVQYKLRARISAPWFVFVCLFVCWLVGLFVYTDDGAAPEAGEETCSE
jgi:hypothetical protein